MSLRVYQVDAFTSEPYAGNPAAVVPLSQPRDERWMRLVAREMNLSETAFPVVRDDGDYDLRWFTPAVEVDLCGHATLATAHVLWETGALPPEREARFHTRSGLLTCRRDGGWIEMDFPAEPPEPIEPPPGLLEALGVAPVFVGRNRMDLFVAIASDGAVRDLVPDIARLRDVPSRGVIVTARDESGRYDFVCRFFAPNAGIDEDPVTGSAFCALGPFWAERLGKGDLLAYQASARGGVVRVRPRGDRVLIAGQAVTTMRGELLA